MDRDELARIAYGDTPPDKPHRREGEDSALLVVEQPVSPPDQGPMMDPALFLWPVERVPADVVEKLKATLLLQCHGGLEPEIDGTVTGETCLGCEHLEGLYRIGRSGKPADDYRGICKAVAERQIDKIANKSAVRCPEASAKVEGAKRGDRVWADHCGACGSFRGMVACEGQGAVRCDSPRGIFFFPFVVE